jgi:hypothetical protein
MLSGNDRQAGRALFFLKKTDHNLFAGCGLFFELN